MFLSVLLLVGKKIADQKRMMEAMSQHGRVCVMKIQFNGEKIHSHYSLKLHIHFLQKALYMYIPPE